MQHEDSSRHALNSNQNPLPRASVGETAQIVRDILGPMVAKGPIRRRPKVMALSQRFDLERRGVRQMQALVEKYGPGPLQFSAFGVNMALVLDPGDVHRVLDETPEPFATTELLKRHALEHFEPRVSLISHGAERAERRAFNDAALGTDHPIHRMAAEMLPAVREEADTLLEQIGFQGGMLRWDGFNRAWFRMVRRVVLGDAARDDNELIEMIEALRSRGNWAFLKPLDRGTRARFLGRLKSLLERAEPGSLAAYMQGISQDEVEPVDQVPQWLFAFDPAGTAAWGALALLASCPRRLTAVRAQKQEQQAQQAALLPELRHAVLDTLRLWPTTPLILRETTREVEFGPGVMPAKTSVLIFAPYFHRDDRHLEYAHRFTPKLWDERRTAGQWPLVPFSDGTAICPGRHLVLLLASHFMARLINGHQFELAKPDLDPGNVPSVLNTYGVEFRITRL